MRRGGMAFAVELVCGFVFEFIPTHLDARRLTPERDRDVVRKRVLSVALRLHVGGERTRPEGR